MAGSKSNNGSNVCPFVETLDGHCVTTSDFVFNTFLFLLGLCILFANIWIVHVLRRSLKDELSHKFVTNLAVADSFIGAFVLYDVIYNIVQFTLYTECVLRIGLFISFNLASVFTLMCFTLERFIKIRKPFSFKKYATLRNIRLCTVLIWSASISVGLMPFFGWSTMDILHICNFFQMMADSYVIMVTLLFCVPFLCMLFLYTNLVWLAWRHTVVIRNANSNTGRVNNRITIFKTIGTAMTIVGVFFLCWAPIGTFTVMVLTSDVDKWLPPEWSENVVFTYLLAIGVSNSLWNPVIYAAKIDIVRKTIRKTTVYKCYKYMKLKMTV